MWGPVIELVDLRYRPEVNTIEALAESDPRKHAPLAEPIWTTTPEESGLGVGKTKIGIFMLLESWGPRRVFGVDPCCRCYVCLCCQVSRESDLRAERTTSCITTWQNGSQAQHIGACEQSKGEAKMLYLDPPCGNGLLVSSIAVLPRADLTWRVHQR